MKAQPDHIGPEVASIYRVRTDDDVEIAVTRLGEGPANGEPVVLMFLTAVSLAVAAVPEALPAVVTISLAFGANAMGSHLPQTRCQDNQRNRRPNIL